MEAPALYEQRYCARGERENRIKEQQLALFADRTWCVMMRANQHRIYVALLAYTLLMQTLREVGLKGAALAHAQCDTIRLKLLELAAHVPVTVHNVRVSFSESHPNAERLTAVHRRLHAPKSSLAQPKPDQPPGPLQGG